MAFSDKAEPDRVKRNFAVKKLWMADDGYPDKAPHAIKEKFGSANRNNFRALAYHMLVKKHK